MDKKLVLLTGIGLVLLLLGALNSVNDKSITGNVIGLIGEESYQITLINATTNSALLQIGSQNISLTEQISEPYTLTTNQNLSFILTEAINEFSADILIGIDYSITNLESIITLDNVNYTLDLINSTSSNATISVNGASVYLEVQSSSPYNLNDAGEINLVLINSNATEVDVKIFFSKIFTISTTCTPNWTLMNASCLSSDEIISYYVDSNSCGQTPAMNISSPCDYDRNGVIGDIEDIDSNLNLNVKIANGEYNLSANYSGIKKIEFIQNNTKLVEFDWNFAEALNFKNIEIRKQSSSASLGYIIVNNLDVNKTIYVDRLTNGSRVCIKDSSVSSISAISSDCDASNEVLLTCPGNSEGYSCSLGINDSQFIISGLMHSAVQEFIGGNCTTDWKCENWSACTGGLEIRLCLDNNNCGILDGKPIEQRDCNGCTPIWDCNDWTPETCKVGTNQTRICVDVNSCGLDLGKPIELRTCEVMTSSASIDYKKLGIIIGILIVIGIIIGVILYFLNKSAEDDSDNSSNNSTNPPKPPLPPKSFMRQPAPPKARPMPRQIVPQASQPLPEVYPVNAPRPNI